MRTVVIHITSSKFIIDVDLVFVDGMCMENSLFSESEISFIINQIKCIINCYY